jgi:S-methylmethionine-dependent homocysteine/selenocysteine methylase
VSGWLDKLRAGGVLVIDGGTGTELRRRGAPWGDTTWSGLAGHARHDLLVQVHCDYIAAGAEVITTNTFGTARFVLEATGYGAEFAAINRSAVAAAKEARGECGVDVAIAGAISCLPPRFDNPTVYPAPALERAAYAELANLFAAEGADLLALEMLQDTERAALACDAARATGLPFWLGVSCRVAPDGKTLVAFDDPDVHIERVFDALLAYEPEVVNIMHSPLDAIAPAIELLRPRWRGFVGVYPEIDTDGPKAALAPQDFASLADQWIDLGVRLVGGCCGTTPEHIRALEATVARRAREAPG